MNFSTIKKSGNRGFSLIETLVVLVILLVLIALVVPTSKIVGYADLQQAIEILQGTISLARQTAIKENRPVEVRFYYYKDPSKPGESEQFRALQYVKYETDVNGSNLIAVPISRIEKLPGDIIIINQPEFSSLITAPELQGSDPVEIDPSIGEATYFSFTFLPDGSADLKDEDAGAWFLTIAQESDLSRSGGDLPSNFITLQVEPFTGALRRLQPQAD